MKNKRNEELVRKQEPKVQDVDELGPPWEGLACLFLLCFFSLSFFCRLIMFVFFYFLLCVWGLFLNVLVMKP